MNLIYLRHQCSDGADTIQFGSTNEYFEAVEYEPNRPSELRDIHETHNIFRSDPTE